MLALVGPSPLQAQPRSEDGPSVDQLMEVLPQTLPAMERTRFRPWSAHGPDSRTPPP